MSWLASAEALRVLQVRPQTLYANVSRKKIRAKPDPKDTRRSLYHEADVRKMARQRGGQRKAAAVAAATIQWGDPILTSEITAVVEERLYYRGRDAAVLAEEMSLEQVAELLWGVAGAPSASRDKHGDHHGEAGTPVRAPSLRGLLGSRLSSSASALQRAFLVLGLRAATDFASYGRSLSVLQSEAASLLVTLADAMLGERTASVSHPRRARRRGAGKGHHSSRKSSELPLIHERIALTWRRREAADIIRRALVLLADHELNASTFAARVAVSTGAPLAAGVLSGLSALSGPLHGRASVGVLQLVSSVGRVGADTTVREWLSLGRHLSGFGHPLYPSGDPRAKALMQHFPLPAEYAELCNIVEQEIGEPPNIDFALSALTRVYGLPREAPLILFALGRCTGWLAHALEQVTAGQPIRPRAHYVGLPPGEPPTPSADR